MLYAVESGSRAWGFESADSDYDVRFIYRRPPEMYVAIDANNLPVEQKDTINVPITSELDVSGWDIRKTLQLLRKSNPPLLEWLESPIVYFENAKAIGKLRRLAKDFYSPKACTHHYLHMAQGNFRQYLSRRDQVIRKKYLYVVRPVLACLWILENGGMPPMEMDGLLPVLAPSKFRGARAAIKKLIAEKKAAAELGRGPVDAVIHAFLEQQLARIEKAAASAPESAGRDSAPLNEYLRWVLKQG